MSNEHLGERGLPMNDTDNSRFLQSYDRGLRHARNRRYATRLSGETTFAEEIVPSKKRHHRFLALFRNNSELDFAPLYEKDRVSRVTL
jgi:hypothetical protein